MNKVREDKKRKEKREVDLVDGNSDKEAEDETRRRQKKDDVYERKNKITNWRQT